MEHSDSEVSVRRRNGRTPQRSGAGRAPAKAAAELAPITVSDIPAVARFLGANLNDRIPWRQACSTPLGQYAAPNLGFLLRDGDQVVGTLLALYSERMVAGRLERICNMGSWCVLPEYRSSSMSLLNAVLAQPGYHFTTLSPDTGPQEILAWLDFEFLDTSAVLVPGLPYPSVPGLVRISTDPAVIERTLSGSDLVIYRDHAGALAGRHMVLTRGDEYCYVIYREFRYGRMPVFAQVLHVSNPELFRRSLRRLARYLLVRRGLLAVLAEVRLLDRRPWMGLALNDWPKMYRSPRSGPQLGADDIDYLYSELMCLPWSRGGLTGRNLVARAGRNRTARGPANRSGG